MIFDQLDILALYPIINTCISLVLAYFVTSVTLKKLSKLRIAFIISMGAVFPLFVIIITNNLDSIYLCIAALADLYTLTTLFFYPIGSGSILLSSTSTGNIGSSAGAGIGSSAGAGIGSSAGAGVGSSTATNVDSPAHNITNQQKQELDEAYSAKREELAKATDNLEYLTFEDNLKRSTAVLMEIQKKRIVSLCEEQSKSAKYMAKQMRDMEAYYTNHLQTELEVYKLFKVGANAPYIGS